MGSSRRGTSATFFAPSWPSGPPNVNLSKFRVYTPFCVLEVDTTLAQPEHPGVAPRGIVGMSADHPPSPATVTSRQLDDIETSVLIVGGGPHALAVLSALHERSLAYPQFVNQNVFNQRVGFDSLRKVGTGAIRVGRCG